jgi:twinfilin-like protein
MLFASTRLTLSRELGSENFTESVFCTLKEELTEEGWKRHEAHVEGENPLTEEERNLEGIKEAEVMEVGGTGRRGGGYGGPSGGLKMNPGEGVVEALSGLQDGGLVMLVSWYRRCVECIIADCGTRKSIPTRRLCLRKQRSVQWILQA